MHEVATRFPFERRGPWREPNWRSPHLYPEINRPRREPAMLYVAIAVFALAAVLGLTMAVLHFKGRSPPPAGLAVVHGLFAASGLVILLVAVIQAHLGGAPLAALGLLILAALGGFGLLSFHLRRRALSSGLLAGHALLAVAGFIVLLISALLLAH